jgi:protein-S-isoprenylcysteine O-methyltransferase Ste14
MNTGAYVVLILNFIYISLLPVVFFKRDGSLNHMWWVTATPFILCFSAATAAMMGYLTPLGGSLADVGVYLQMLAVVFNVASIALISFTLGTHRIPIALWHQNNDAPKGIVTWGAYGHIRHPFYASFLLYFIGGLLFLPSLFTLVALIYGFVILNLTAAREEKRLSMSEFGQEYIDYIARTGRFLPRLKRS